SASGLLDQATEAEEEGHYAEAAKLLYHYLGYVPNDIDALARYGSALDKLPPTPVLRLRTMLVFNQVLRHDDRRTDIRRRLVSLAMDAKRYEEAKEHLGKLLENSKNDAELDELLGRCYEEEKDLKGAEKHYRNLIEVAPKRISPYAALARVLRQSDK